MTIPVNLGVDSYDIIIGRGLLQRAGNLIDLNRRVLIVTDSGVPAGYSAVVTKQCLAPVVETIPIGEGSKSYEMLIRLHRVMLENDFSRNDCVVAVGGGVVGDLAGFTAATYMRGIDFYNIPTTVLSQVDSSVGGKTAINLNGIKNVIGAFWQPKRVLIDPDVLGTLSERQLSNGLAEALKMAMTSDADLFRLFEGEDPFAHLDEIIAASVRIKAKVVEADERESGLRRILNFGHTIGHTIESEGGLNGLLHGECVALGMIPMCDTEARSRLVPILKKLNLPSSYPVEPESLYDTMRHDKKAVDDSVVVTVVTEPGKYELRTMPIIDVIERAKILRKTTNF